MMASSLALVSFVALSSTWITRSWSNSTTKISLWFLRSMLWRLVHILARFQNRREECFEICAVFKVKPEGGGTASRQSDMQSLILILRVWTSLFNKRRHILTSG